MTKATYTKPRHVATYVKPATQSWLAGDRPQTAAAPDLAASLLGTPRAAKCALAPTDHLRKPRGALQSRDEAARDRLIVPPELMPEPSHTINLVVGPVEVSFFAASTSSRCCRAERRLGSASACLWA